MITYTSRCPVDLDPGMMLRLTLLGSSELFLLEFDDDDDLCETHPGMQEIRVLEAAHANRRYECEDIVTGCLSSLRGAAVKEMRTAAIATNKTSGGCHQLCHQLCHLEKGHISFWWFTEGIVNAEKDGMGNMNTRSIT